MSNIASNFKAKSVNIANLVKTRNCFEIGDWSLFYNQEKNQAKFDFYDIEPHAVCIKISGSTGWVRLLRPVDFQDKSGVYSVSLSLRSLTVNPQSKYIPYVFVCEKSGRFQKHSKLTKFDEGYKTNLHISSGSPKFWIGFETVEPNIQFLLDQINLEVIESSVELENNLKDCKKVDLPQSSTEPKSANYKAVETWNKDYQQLVSVGELPFLLNFAIGLRRVEMPETFLRIIKYLVVKYSDLDQKHRAMLALQVRNALLVSHDKHLIQLILTHCPEMLLTLDLNDEIYANLTGLECSDEKLKFDDLDKHAYFSLQKDPSRLFQLIRRETAKNPEYLQNNPAAYCALANAYALNINCSTQYTAFLNKYLIHYGLPKLDTVTGDGQQGLHGFRFEKSNREVDKGPLVSVMMSAHNSAETITYAIESLLNQTYRNIEVLVCDDQSSDDTLDLALTWSAKDSRVRVFQSKRNQGTYNIRNSLIKEAKGEFLTFQDSDDLAIPCRIEEQLNVLSCESKLVCFSHWVRMGETGKIVYFHDGFVSRFCVVSALAHRTVFARMPPFRSALVAADTEFYELCKYLLGEEKIAIVKKPLIIGHWGQGSLTKRDNLNADHSGFVASKRRNYAEIAARQRLLGDILVSDHEVDDALRRLEIYRQPFGIESVAADRNLSIATNKKAFPTEETCSSVSVNTCETNSSDVMTEPAVIGSKQLAA